MAKLTYMENELRKAEGRLFSDTAKGFLMSLGIRTLVDIYNNSWSINLPKRLLLEQCIFGKFGKSWMEPPVHVCVGKNTTIGDRCYFNFNTTFIDDYKINIGNDVLFGANVSVITTGHPVHHELRAHGEMYCAPVTIKDRVWVGSGVTILPGVTIGENSVIGAGSIVTKDIPANVIAVGVPCKVMREIDEHDKKFYYKDRDIDFGRLDS